MIEQVNGQTAKEISEMLLGETATALLRVDFRAFSNCFALPHFISTSEKSTILETVEDLHFVFLGVVGDYDRKQVTELVRCCEAAAFRSETQIEATHTTHMMSGNQRIIEPFPSFSILKLIDGRWKISTSQYAVDNHTTVGHALNRATRYPTG